MFVSLKELLRERKSQSENPLGIRCVLHLQPEVSANITRQATEDKTNGSWSAGDQGSLRLCLGIAAHLRLQLVGLQLEGGLHFGSSGGSDISIGVVQ